MPPTTRGPKEEAWHLPGTTSRPQFLDSDGGDTEFRRLIYGIFTMAVNFDRIRERLATSLGLSGKQYHILMVVAELAPHQPVTISTVANQLHISSAYTTMETKKLLSRGLLRKRPNPDDGRSVILELTADGRAAIEGLAPCLREINDTLFEDMGPETFRQFLGIIDHMKRTSSRAADLSDHMARRWLEPASGAVRR